MKEYTAKDGSKVVIRKMEDSHLVNAIRFFSRQLKRVDDEMAAATMFGEPSGEMASYYFDSEMGRMFDASVSLEKLVYALKQEAKRRDLDSLKDPQG